MAAADWRFYHSPRFYLVLFLGFLTCIGWSLILNAIKKEKAKSDLDSVYKLRISDAEKEISEGENKLNDFKKAAIALKSEILNIECEIDRLKKSLTSVQFNLHVLKKRISSFYSGWMTYVTNLADNETLRKTCEEVMIDFKHQYLAPAFVQNEAKPSEN
jgi:chromosome segregation ATPase